MARPKGQAPKPEVLQKETQVVNLRRQGHTWDQIAQIVGYKDPSGAHSAYMRASARVVAEDVEAIRQIETQRLDMLQSAYWIQAMSGDVPSGLQVLRIMERRSKLLGLDQPVRQQVEVTTYDPANIDAEVAKLVALLDSGQTGEVGTPPSTT